MNGMHTFQEPNYHGIETPTPTGGVGTNPRLAIIGCGKWGINHVRTAYNLLNSNLRIVCDLNTSARRKVQAISKTIPFTTNLEDVLKDQDINSVIIATPPSTHHETAKHCLEHGKHVLVEKPITLVADDARDLVRIALEKERVLMVGHVLLYHPAIIKLKEGIDRGRIGKIMYIYSNRLNLGTIRSEENILWSFAPHDISIIQYLTESYPIYIDAKGANFLQNNIEDTTLTYLVYPNNIHAHIFVSWLHPFKEHRLIVVGSRGMMVFEDNLKQNKLRFYPNGFQDSNGRYEKFEGDYEVIDYDDSQPLTNEQKHFFDAVLLETKPLSDGQHALEVLDILEKAQSRLRKYDYAPPFLSKASIGSALT
jgi:UDP-2-acetamido-3-amino-2,3-dideoxy-glucuronate N-acetyltransferase